MITEREARKIALEYVRNQVLKVRTNTLMDINSSRPREWIFHIHNINDDNDVFLTKVTVTNNGIVSDWETKYISDEEQ